LNDGFIGRMAAAFHAGNVVGAKAATPASALR
jgi:hypothetical protein